MKYKSLISLAAAALLLPVVVGCRPGQDTDRGGEDRPPATGPVPLWTRTYGGSGEEEARAVRELFDGGFVIAGWTTSGGAGGEDVYLVRTDASGGTLWEKTFGGPGDDRAYSVQVTGDGGFIIVGRTQSFGDAFESVYLVKTGADGTEEWSRTFGEGRRNGGRDVRQTSDGGYIISGWTGEERHHDSVDLLLTKTDGQGHIQWNGSYPEPHWQACHEVRQTPDGGYVIAAIERKPDEGMSGYIVRTDEKGGILWRRWYGVKLWDEWHGVEETPDGGFIFCGGAKSTPGQRRMQAWVLKADGGEEITWQRSYGAETGYMWSIAPTRDGGYVVAGRGGRRGKTPGVMKIDGDGGLVWHYIAREEKKKGLARSVLQSGDGGIVAAGYTESLETGNRDFWLTKLADPGI